MQEELRLRRKKFSVADECTGTVTRKSTEGDVYWNYRTIFLVFFKNKVLLSRYNEIKLNSEKGSFTLYTSVNIGPSR